jgi:nitroreductase
MPTIPADTLLAQLNWRYATKQFEAGKQIPAATWDALVQALVLSPSSYGLQPWKFLVVTKPELKQQLRAASWNQSQVTDCSHHVVFLAKKQITEADVDRFIAATATTRGIPTTALAGYKGYMMGDLVNGARSKIIGEWAARQCYIALGNLMTSAALLGVDACPMEGLDPVKYDEILGLTGGDYGTVVALPLGYRAATDKSAGAKKVRYPVEQVVEYR